MANYTHDWVNTEQYSPSGRVLFRCSKCGLYDVAPVKPEFETRPCKDDGEEADGGRNK